MSTHSLVGVRVKPDQVIYAYVHFDGYPNGVGKTLLDHYSTGTSKEVEAKILKAIQQGDMRSIGPESHEKIDPLDSGEDTSCKVCDDPLDLAVRGMRCGAEWVYLFDSLGWMVAHVCGDRWSKFEKLTQALVEMKGEDAYKHFGCPLNKIASE